MRKHFVVLVTSFLALSLSACGSSNSGSSQSSSGSSSVEKKEISVEPFTAIDNEYCSITIKSIDPKNKWGYTVQTTLENKSADVTYMFSVQSAAINGVDTDPLFATEVAPGKKSNSDISFPTSSLKDNGISDFTDIEMVFRVYDTNNWSADPVALETVHVYPYGEEEAVVFTREIKETDTVIIDDENITAIITGIDPDNTWGYTVNLFLINKTESGTMFAVEEASVNGYMIDPFFAKDVAAGKCAFTSMSWTKTSLEENDISEVEEIEFRLRVYDDTNWNREPYFNDIVTINP